MLPSEDGLKENDGSVIYTHAQQAISTEEGKNSEFQQDLKPDFFMGGHWGQCLDLVKHLTQYSHHVLLVIGKPGVGKSLLKSALINDTHFSAQPIIIEASENITETQVLRQLEMVAGQASLEQQGVLMGHGKSEDSPQKSKIKVLFIEDAHLFSDQILQTITKTCQNYNNRLQPLHLVFIGDLSLEQRFQSPLFQEVCHDNLHVVEIDPLNFDEMQRYIHHKVKMREDLLDKFSAKTMKQIYKVSQGIPQAVDAYCEKIISGEAINSASLFKRAKSAFSPFYFVLTIFAVITLLIITMLPSISDFMLNNIDINQLLPDKKQEAYKSPNKPTQAIETRRQKQKNESTQDDKKMNLVTKDATATKPIEQPQSINTPIVNDKSTVAVTTSAETKITQKKEDKSDQIYDLIHSKLSAEKNKAKQKKSFESDTEKTKTSLQIKPKVIITAEVPKNARLNQVEQKQPSKSLATGLNSKPIDSDRLKTQAENRTQENESVKAKSKSEIKSEAKSKQKPVFNKPAVIGKPAKQQTKPSPTIVTTTTKASSIKKIIPKQKQTMAKHTLMEQKILKVEGNHYALQIIGVKSEANLKTFMKRNRLSSNVYYYKTRYNKKPWYVLVYGDYATREQAVKAIKQLPADLQAMKPWPRSFTSIQQAITQQKG